MSIVSARVPHPTKVLIEAAAAELGLSVSKYAAQRLHDAALEDLVEAERLRREPSDGER